MDLTRFLLAQDEVYATALGELRHGAKRSHWIWFIFPQIAGLGRSETARYYALAGRAEAKAFAEHPLLGPRLVECCDALMAWRGRKEIEAMLGALDAMKLRSSMTLFEAVASDPRPFAAIIAAFFAGERDVCTLELLSAASR